MSHRDTEVMIVGRKEIAREGLRHILVQQGFTVLTTAPGHPDMVRASEQNAPQLFIIDSLNADEGIETCAILHDAYPDARIVILADECDLDSIGRALAAGADGYLVKAMSCEPLVGSLQLVMMGEKVVPSQALSALSDPLVQMRNVNWDAARLGVNLSEREIEILQQLVRGDSNKLISRRLLITEATVKVHVKAILRKLHVLNRTQAAIWAVSQGLGGAENMRSINSAPIDGALVKRTMPPPGARPIGRIPAAMTSYAA